MMGRTKRVGGNIGPKARQPLPGALHKKRREWGRGGRASVELAFQQKNMNQDRFSRSLSRCPLKKVVRELIVLDREFGTLFKLR